jgi:glutamine synthetase
MVGGRIVQAGPADQRYGSAMTGQGNSSELQAQLADAERADATQRALALIEERKLEVVRLSFADQHGQLRGKTIMAADFAAALRTGHSVTSSLLLKDTSHRTVFPIWESAQEGMSDFVGARDVIMLPDPTTFKVLPWSPHSGWVLCDLYFPDGRAVPHSTRRIGRAAASRLQDLGYDYVCGLEVEFHVFKLLDAKLQPEHAGQPGSPPETQLLAHGFQYLTESRYDELEPVMDLIRRCAVALDLPVRSFEVEFGPSQFEVTFHPARGMAHADNMVVFRSAVKQVCRRNGYHATFMCRPRLANIVSSGWHLHQSLIDRATQTNAFIPGDDGALLSPVGLQFVAGILEHARACCLFTTPTINAYKRFAPRSLAPDRVLWGRDNRGAMLRVIGGPGDPATRIENRVGEPAANPYLYLASQIHCGIDGIEHGRVPMAAADAPYDTAATALPRNLMEAIAAARSSEFLRKTFGAAFIDYLLAIKEAEVARYLGDLSEWEQREYFEMF